MKKSYFFVLILLTIVNSANGQTQRETLNFLELNERANFLEVNNRYELISDNIYYNKPGFLIYPDYDILERDGVEYIIVTYPDYKKRKKM